jgi:predicted RNA binding protein YcfA (HicA-like mRNA interferase family)
MPKLYSSDEIIRVLKKYNFGFVSQKGSHGKFKNHSGRTVIIPMNKNEIPVGTFRSILKQAGFTLQQFIESL